MNEKNKILKNFGLVIIAVLLFAIASPGSSNLNIVSKLENSDWNLLSSINKAVSSAFGQSQLYQSQLDLEQAVIDTAKRVSPAVVSIIQTKDVPVIEQYYSSPFGPDDPFNFLFPQFRQNGTEKQEVGGGSGFIISSDGIIATNKHVVSDAQSEYTVLTNDGKRYPARILARDPLQDLAVLKIEATNLPTVALGDSNSIQVGQFVVAIGNSLGEFSNTVSFGVVSGIRRNISASGQGGVQETLDEVIQTDAAINPGNSGGPLLNLKGEVIGINTAMATGAENIGFAIPINKVKSNISSVQRTGKITYPFLGVRYVIINNEVQAQRNLSVDYGALVSQGSQGESAITPGSPAEKAGIRTGDIILEANGRKITPDNTLSSVIQSLRSGETIHLKVLRSGQAIDVDAVLSERSS